VQAATAHSAAQGPVPCIPICTSWLHAASRGRRNSLNYYHTRRESTCFPPLPSPHIHARSANCAAFLDFISQLVTRSIAIRPTLRHPTPASDDAGQDAPGPGPVPGAGNCGGMCAFIHARPWPPRGECPILYRASWVASASVASAGSSQAGFEPPPITFAMRGLAQAWTNAGAAPPLLPDRGGCSATCLMAGAAGLLAATCTEHTKPPAPTLPFTLGTHAGMKPGSKPDQHPPQGPPHHSPALPRAAASAAA